MHLRALLFDLGDTIMLEETEVKDAGETTLRAALVPGIADALRALRVAGYPLALVADTRPLTPVNVLGQHGLLNLFDTLAISELVGVSKPDPAIFRAALDALGITPHEYSRVVMVGNNLERDVAGANRLGLVSVFYYLNDRRRTQPEAADEVPCYTVRTPAELTELISSLEEAAEMSFITREAKGLTKCLVEAGIDPSRLRVHISAVPPGSSSHPPHTHDAVEAFYIFEGRASVLVEGEHHELGPNEVMILDASRPHGMSNAGDTTLRYMVIISENRQ
jgi:putative hydrolase of the HAD superfamily